MSALEIDCGTGHPLLDLVEQGLNVDGLDSSRDMLVRCEAGAQARGLRVSLHQQEMQHRTIFFAGASFIVLGSDGKPADGDAPTFVVVALRPAGSV